MIQAMTAPVTDSTTEPVGPTAMGQRLGSCRDRIDELQEQLRQERERRNRLIVEARDDEGLGYGTIAKYAGVSKTLVIGVLAAN